MFDCHQPNPSIAIPPRRRSTKSALKGMVRPAAALVTAALCSSASPGVALAQAEPPAAATDCDRLAASDFDKQSPVAGIAFSKIDPKAAIPACLEALSKNPDSARLNFELGRAYDADKNFVEAVKYFVKAAASHFALAEVNLGTLYFNGQGVEKDYAEAAKWDRRAADQGLAPAQAALGSMYVLGQGVPQDFLEAEKLLRLAAAQGFAPAQNSLGALYANGEGVARDYAEATKWYAAAAAQGYAPAKASLEALDAEGLAAATAANADTTRQSSATARPKADPNAPRYVAAPAGMDYPPVKISVKAPDSRVSNRVAATTIEISPLSSSFAMTGFAVNKGNCRVFIADPTALLRSAEADKSSNERQAEMEKISLVAPPFDPPVSAGPGQYMTFYVDPNACAIDEVEVLVNGFEWTWRPG
jgi:TPR repeat protein